jgi:hypothetical protein
MAKGDHIYVNRLGYTHHGIDCGDGTVIHFTGEPLKKYNSSVARTPLAEFASESRVKIRRYKTRDTPQTAFDRAESRVGIRGYNLVFNNCEHFATWCCTGNFKSRQVRNAVRVGGGIAGGIPAAVPAASAAILLGAASFGVYGTYRAARKLPGLRR